MKLIKSSATIIEQEKGIDGIYKAIELAGRTCYKSEDKITNTSNKEFVDRMIKSGHHAMLEFGTVYLTIPTAVIDNDLEFPLDVYLLLRNPYTKYVTNDVFYYITTNYRVIVYNKLEDVLKYATEPTEYHEKRMFVKFITDRGVSHELVRHRVFSFAQESTRYCNYSKDKFGNELTFIIPSYIDINDTDESNEVNRMWNIDLLDYSTLISEEKAFDKNIDYFLYSLESSEYAYLNMLKSGYTPQQARQVLPNALKTEINVCGFESDWNEFFKLRDTKSAHPDMQLLVQRLKNDPNLQHFKRVLRSSSTNDYVKSNQE